MCTDSYQGQTLLLKIINNTSFGKINNLLSQGREMKHGQATQQYVSDFKDVMDLKVLNPFGKHICHGAPQKYI
jgi:hypothetical protein